MIRKFVPLIAVILSCCATTVPPDAGPKAEETLLDLLKHDAALAPCPSDRFLTLSGEITEESADATARAIRGCEGHEILIEFNSLGGSVFAAMEIQRAIERHDRPVSCIADGPVMSAAFVTFQSCAHRYVTDRAILMAHEASLGARGQSQEFSNAADALRVVNWTMAEHCARRMGISHEEFAARVANGQEWHFSQADALRFHAADDPADSIAAALALLKGG